MSTLTHGVFLEPARQQRSPMSSFRWRAGRRRSNACRPTFSSARPRRPWPSPSGCGAPASRPPRSRRRSRAISARSARARPSRPFSPAAAKPTTPQAEADIQLLRIAEHLLASAIGAASSRLVLSLLLRRRNVSSAAALRLLDDASAALLYNRDMLQHALDFARQGISVFDADLRLTCWNREFRDMFGLPAGITPASAWRSTTSCASTPSAAFTAMARWTNWSSRRLERLTNTEPFRVASRPPARSIETRAARMPDGGLVVTYTDVTEQFAAEQALEAANEMPGAAGARAHRAIDAAQRGAGARQGATPKTPIFPRRGFSPPPATTSCNRSTPRGFTPRLMIQRAEAGAPREETVGAGAQCRFVARSGGGYFLGPARNVAPRRRGDESRAQQSSQSTICSGSCGSNSRRSPRKRG